MAARTTVHPDGGYLHVTDWRVGMCWDPNAENHDVDASDDTDGAPFDPGYRLLVLGDDGDTDNDDLHKQLNFKSPQKQQKEENRYSVDQFVRFCLVILLQESYGTETYVGDMIKSRSSHARMPMARLAMISPQTI